MSRPADAVAPPGQPGPRDPADAQAPPRQAYWEALAELAAADDRVVCLDSDLGGLRGAFRDRFPGRYIDAGIAEANLFTVAAGLAAAGHVPFVHTMAAFATSRAAEQLKLDIVGHDLPVRVVATHGGLSAAHFGPTHYALEDLAVARSMPGLAVVIPAESGEIGPLLRALHERPGPCYLRVGRAATPGVHGRAAELELGRALELRPGDQISIIACGPLPTVMALEAARALADRTGTAARVLEMHTLVPLDEAAVIRAARQTGGIVTVEEHRSCGGLGDAVSEVVGRERPCPVVRVAVSGLPGRVGGHRDLLELGGVSVQAITDAADRIVNLRRDCERSRKGPTMHESQADTGPGTSVTAAQVAGLVARVLDRLDVAPDDDFFLLGGSSLLAMQLLDLVATEFGVTLPARQFYLNTRVDQLATAINGLRPTA